MKRKILSVLAVLVAVLMSTVVLTACEKAPAGLENGGGSSESMSTEQGGEPSVNESAAESSGESALNESKNSGIIIPDEPYEDEPEESKKEHVPSVTPGKKASVQADFFRFARVCSFKRIRTACAFHDRWQLLFGRALRLLRKHRNIPAL